MLAASSTGLTRNDVSSACLPLARAGLSIGAFEDETRFSKNSRGPLRDLAKGQPGARMIDYREIKFEEAIEDHLTHHGYTKADSKNFDRALALDPTVLLAFIRETQPAKWKTIADYHGQNAETVFLEEVTRGMD